MPLLDRETILVKFFLSDVQVSRSYAQVNYCLL